MSSVISQISVKLKQFRIERSLSLTELAAATGFTKSYLSKIENAGKVPPIGTLARISAALDVPLSDFFSDPSTNCQPEQKKVAVVLANERPSIVRGGTTFGYDYESLAGGFANGWMTPFVFTFPENISEDVYFEHEGQEFLFILSGRVNFTVGDQEWVLGAGDSIYFDASLPHRGYALGKEAKALVISCEVDPALNSAVSK